jgi:hypothetical protein
VNRATAVETLRRCVEALSRGPDPAERSRLLELHEQALRMLDPSRPATRAITNAVARLERKLKHLAPGERVAAICARLHLSRSAYYRHRQSHTKLGLAGDVIGSVTERT